MSTPDTGQAQGSGCQVGDREMTGPVLKADSSPYRREHYMTDDMGNQVDTEVAEKPDDGLVVAVETIATAQDRRAERGGFLDM
jgi:hypothetical protein